MRRPRLDPAQAGADLGLHDAVAREPLALVLVAHAVVEVPERIDDYRVHPAGAGRRRFLELRALVAGRLVIIGGAVGRQRLAATVGAAHRLTGEIAVRVLLDVLRAREIAGRYGHDLAARIGDELPRLVRASGRPAGRDQRIGIIGIGFAGLRAAAEARDGRGQIGRGDDAARSLACRGRQCLRRGACRRHVPFGIGVGRTARLRARLGRDSIARRCGLNRAGGAGGGPRGSRARLGDTGHRRLCNRRG